MSEFQHDAILRGWSILDASDGRGKIVAGRIFGDSKGRFRDGQYVYTSLVQKFDGEQVTTRNTRYLLDGPAAAAPEVRVCADEP